MKRECTTNTVMMIYPNAIISYTNYYIKIYVRMYKN